MHTYTLRGVEVQFPYQAYECQLTYMEKVIQALQEGSNALLESPTGTGKTLCLLCAALAWRESLKPKVKAEQVPGKDPQKEWADELRAAQEAPHASFIPPIIYASRTHSQLAQVIRELRSTAYRPHMSILGSRQQMCLHAPVARAPAAAISQACHAAVQAQSCLRVHKVEPFIRGQPDIAKQPLDIEDLMHLGQVQGPCPFYLARELAASAELIFMPYNYLVDTKTRSAMKQLSWEGAVLIFDEAHNLEGVCCEAASFDLGPEILAGCIQEVKAARDVAVKRRDGEQLRGLAKAYSGCGLRAVHNAGMGTEPNITADLTALQRLLAGLEGAIGAVKPGREGLTAPGRFLWQLLGRAGITLQSCPLMVMLMATAGELLTGTGQEGPALLGPLGSEREKGLKLSLLADMLRLAMMTAEPVGTHKQPRMQGYRVHIHLAPSRSHKRGSTGQQSLLDARPTLSYWCFAPGAAMQELVSLKIRCIILTSGTLSPLDSFAAELQQPFPVTLENPHVIDPSQAWVGVVPLGPAGCALNSSFANRESQAYREDLGNALVNLARMVPDGMLVFFPSYVVLRGCIDAWKASYGSGQSWGSSIWERITAHKQPVIEPQDSNLFPQAALDYKSKLQDHSSMGAVFFAVCRGKVSEGLDFSDRAGRAVVVTGLPYPNKIDPKVRLKREVLDEMARSAASSLGKRPRSGGGAGGVPVVRALTGEAWYVQQASRAVNQAMGRVIRHRHDYGAIILCDDRFQAENTQHQLSCWLRGLVKVQPHFGAVSSSLTKFFREQSAAAAAAARARGLHSAAAPRPPKVTFNMLPTRAASSAHEAATGPCRLQVPAAVDVQGLAELGLLAAGTSASAAAARPPSGQDGCEPSALMAALHKSPVAGQAAGQAQGGAAPGGAPAQEPGSLADSLWAHVHGQQGRPSSAQAGGSRADVPSSSGPATDMELRCPSSPEHAAQIARPTAPSDVVGPAHIISSLNAQPAQPRALAPAQHVQLQQSAHCSKAAEPAAVQPPSIDISNSQDGAAPGQLAAKESAKAYLDRLERELPADAYQQVKRALRGYRSGKDGPLALTDTMVEVLRVPGRHHLLPGFVQLLSKQQRGWFKQCVACIPGLATCSGYPELDSVCLTASLARSGILGASPAQQGRGQPDPPDLQPQPSSSHPQASNTAEPSSHRHPATSSQGQSSQGWQRPPRPSATPAPPTAPLASGQALPVPGRPPSRPGPAPGQTAPASSASGREGAPVGAAEPQGGRTHHIAGHQPARGLPGPRGHALREQGVGSRPQHAHASHEGGGAISHPRAPAGSRAQPPVRSAVPASASGRQRQQAGPSSRPASISATDSRMQPARPPQARAGPPQGAQAASTSGQQQTPACIICGAQQMKVPWGARCGHVACYACWVAALKKAKECPACGRQTQLRQMKQKCFV